MLRRARALGGPPRVHVLAHDCFARARGALRVRLSTATAGRRTRLYGLPPSGLPVLSTPVSCRALATQGEQAEPAEGEGFAAEVERPTQNQLRQIFTASAIPFVGFGFFDNFVMILAGDLIDSTLCVTFCFSTMAAAAIGNTLSDIIGIYSGGIIEQMAEARGIREPPLTTEQRLLRVSKAYQYTGQVVGIVTGCILGMCPLLILDPEAGANLKREKELEASLADALPLMSRILKAEAILLMGVDEEKDEVTCIQATVNIPDVKPWSTKHGLIGHVARTGRFTNVADVSQTPFYYPQLHDNFQGSDMAIRSMLCVPVLRGEKVVGVLAAFNKADSGAFTEKDEDRLSFLASHVAVRMEAVLDEPQSFKDVVLTCEKVMAKQESIEFGSHTAQQRRAELYLPALNGISRVLQAQSTALMLLDDEKNELYTEAITGEFPKHRNKMGEGIAGKCAVQGRILNVDRSVPVDATSFDKERHNDYLGTGFTVHSELCVPMFTSDRKCMGVIKVINKEGGGAFDKEDVTFATEVANNLAIMLEDDGGIKRVLALTRQQLQHKAATTGESADHNTILCFLDRGLNLPTNADSFGVGIDPYVTIQIVRGNPLNNPHMQDVIRKERKNDKTEAERKFGKSKTIMQNANPQWDETIAVRVPAPLRRVPESELFAHVLLWDYDSWKVDDLIGQAAFPVSAMPKGKSKAVKPLHLQPIPGVDQYDLEGSRLWVSFSRARKESDPAPALTPPSASAKGEPDAWAGDNYAPKVGQTAAERFQANKDFLPIIDAVTASLSTECGVSLAEIEKTRRQPDAGMVVCTISDPSKVDCPLVYVSKGFEEMTGYPRSYALGRNCRFLQPADRKSNDEGNAADRDRMRKFIHGDKATGNVLWAILLNESKEGRVFWNLLRLQKVYVGEEGKPYIFAVQREFKNAPADMQEVSSMRARLATHARAGTVPQDVFAWAGLDAIE